MNHVQTPNKLREMISRVRKIDWTQVRIIDLVKWTPCYKWREGNKQHVSRATLSPAQLCLPVLISVGPYEKNICFPDLKRIHLKGRTECRRVCKLVTQSCSTLATPRTIAHQVPLFMQFSRKEYWSGSPFPSPGDLPDPGIEPVSLHCRRILYWPSYKGSHRGKEPACQSLRHKRCGLGCGMILVTKIWDREYSYGDRKSLSFILLFFLGLRITY